MQRMLERHMDDETRAFMLEKIDAMEQVGLSYQQHGIPYQNAHYDMSFILKDLSSKEFNHLKAIIGQSSEKLNTARVENYRTISFTADEYERLKKDLARQKIRSFVPTCSANFQLLCYIAYPVFFIASFFITSPAEKLKFDFCDNSLIIALDSYVTNFDKWNYHQQVEAWMKVGKAQREVPAHIAHEYCRPDRSFSPLPSFNEENLPRTLAFDNRTGIAGKSWFPLSSSSSGLDFDFALMRGSRERGMWQVARGASAGEAVDEAVAVVDLASVRHLDEVRIADLTQSRENLSRPASQLGLVH